MDFTLKLAEVIISIICCVVYMSLLYMVSLQCFVAYQDLKKDEI